MKFAERCTHNMLLRGCPSKMFKFIQGQYKGLKDGLLGKKFTTEQYETLNRKFKETQ